MKWSVVKNLMLGLLMVMNVFMIGSMLLQRFNDEKIPPLVTAAAIDALDNNGIRCDTALMPDNYLTVRTFSGRFYNAMELSRMFFGEELAFQTEDRTLIARQGAAELRVEDEHFTYNSGAAAAASGERELRLALKAFGLDMSRAAYNGGGEFACVYDGRPVFGMYLRAAVDADGRLVSLDARWPSIGHALGRQTGISIIGCIPEVISRFPEGGTVSGLKAGYSPVINETTGTCSFVPAWQITMKNGRNEIFVVE